MTYQQIYTEIPTKCIYCTFTLLLSWNVTLIVKWYWRIHRTSTDRNPLNALKIPYFIGQWWIYLIIKLIMYFGFSGLPDVKWGFSDIMFNVSLLRSENSFLLEMACCLPGFWGMIGRYDSRKSRKFYVLMLNLWLKIFI